MRLCHYTRIIRIQSASLDPRAVIDVDVVLAGGDITAICGISCVPHSVQMAILLIVQHEEESSVAIRALLAAIPYHIVHEIHIEHFVSGNSGPSVKEIFQRIVSPDSLLHSPGAAYIETREMSGAPSCWFAARCMLFPSDTDQRM